MVAGVTSLTFSFAFDKVNQMVSRTISNDLYSWSPDTNSSETYSRNGLNQYTTVSANPFKYDGNGSLTDTHDGTVNDGWAYAYDVENRLTSATNKANGQVTTYDYDPMGRLYSQNNNGVVTSYLYDGVEPIQDYNASGVIIRRFFNGAGVDERVAYKTYDGVTSALTSHKYYMADHQGSVIGISQSCCNNAYAKQAYGEFGVPESGNMGDQPFGYTGRRYDADTGLYYYRARFYKADLGRFLQTDPIGYEDQMNMYSYVGNSPMMSTDPSGENSTFWHEFRASGGYANAVKNAEKHPLPPHWTKDALKYSFGGTVLVATGGVAFALLPAEIQLLVSGSTILALDVNALADGMPAGGSLVRFTKAEQLAKNVAQGTRGEAIVVARLGDDVANTQVTFVTSTGPRSKVDIVTVERTIIEVKTGGARLSPNQKLLMADVNAGRQVTPVGARAEEAGFVRGIPTTLVGCSTVRIDC